MRRAAPLKQLALFALAVAVAAGSVWALAAGGTPAQSAPVPYRGYLEKDGQPVNGVRELIFSLFDGADESATELWQETHPNVQVLNGRFSVLLGTTNPLDGEVMAGDRYLAVAVKEGSSTIPLLGRQRLGAAPMAKRADLAERAERADFAERTPFPYAIVSQRDPFGDGSQVAYLRFENNYDDEMGNYGGSPVGSPSFVDGRYGKALQVSPNNYFQSDADVTLTGAMPRSLVAWVKRLQPGDFFRRSMVGWGATVGQFGLSEAGTFLLARTGPEIEVYGAFVFMRGEAKVAARIGLDAHWHFVAATYHGETMQLYIDARREGYWADYPISTIATRLFVGYKADNDQFIMGASCAVDSVRLFNRALSPWEIEALYYLGQ